VIGGPLYALNFYFERPLLVHLQTYIARGIVTSSYSTTVNATEQFETSVARCGTASTYNGCAALAATTAVGKLAPAKTEIASNAFVPPDAINDMNQYRTYFDELMDELTVVQYSTSSSTQQVEVNDIATTFSNFRAAYGRLWVVLQD